MIASYDSLMFVCRVLEGSSNFKAAFVWQVLQNMVNRIVGPLLHLKPANFIRWEHLAL